MNISPNRLLEDCAQQLHTLEQLLEQEESELPGCFLGDLLEHHQSITRTSLEQLREIKKTLWKLISELPT